LYALISLFTGSLLFYKKRFLNYISCGHKSSFNVKKFDTFNFKKTKSICSGIYNCFGLALLCIKMINEDTLKIEINVSEQEYFRDHKKNTLNYFVYQLKDPFTLEICYIGKTNDPFKKYDDVCNPNLYMSHGGLFLWLSYLASKKEKPILTFIWHVKGMEARNEIKKIRKEEIKNHWALGHPLLNRTIREIGARERIFKSKFWCLVRQHIDEENSIPPVYKKMSDSNKTK